LWPDRTLKARIPAYPHPWTNLNQIHLDLARASSSTKGEYGRGATAEAIDLYNAGYRSRECLALALLARIPGLEAAKKVVTSGTVH
jgi:hypothetical protein